jgi:5-methylcytosine-specific restriction endonuclease McrA
MGKPYRDMTDAEKQRHLENKRRYEVRNKEQIAEYRKTARVHTRWSASRKESYRRLKCQAIILLGGRCVRCQLDDMRCLEIDHIIPVRGDRSIYGVKLYRSVVSGNKDNLQVLCANCHAIKTYEDGNE